ncbi:MAG: TonB-dependent receptor [Phycisphaerae bacterium]|nr:TonB-dependent receptor [Saprospiraceae bacterium]
MRFGRRSAALWCFARHGTNGSRRNSTQYPAHIPKGGTPEWEILNFHAGYEWRLISLRLTALNLFNQDYRTHGSGMNGYGRSVFASVGVRF